MAAIEALETKIKEKAKSYEDTFNGKITANLNEAKITDARLMELSTETKVEYSSEFSIDKIAGVVTSAIKAYGQAAGPAGKVTAESATSPAALDSYVDLVNEVAEAAKTTSKSAASFSYSMHRLGPGLFAFLSATSSNIEDHETFGNEAITATCFMYRLVESEDDIKQSTGFDNTMNQAATYKAAAESDKAVVLKWKTLQEKLVDQVADGTLDPDQYEKKNDMYQKFVDSAMERLDNEHFGEAEVPTRRLLLATTVASPTVNRNYKVINMRLKESLAHKDLKNLMRIKSTRTSAHKTAAEALSTVAAKIEERLSSNIYGQSLLGELPK